MVRGSGPPTADRRAWQPGSGSRRARGSTHPVRRDTARGRCGPVWWRRWVHRPTSLTPNRPLAVPRRAETMRAMEVISSRPSVRRPAVGPVVGGTIVATVAIVAGVVLGWAALATPLLSAVIPSGRADISQMAAGMAVWAIALVGPAALLLVGANRLARILGGARARMPSPSRIEVALDHLSEDVSLARGLALPDGRGVSDVVVGPFGAAIIRQLPSAEVTRIRNGHWELRSRRGWVPMENPLDRASRDAERVRRWLGHDDTDFVVKTYAAVVGDAPAIPRTAACAVLTFDQLGAWVAALPPQRTLTPGRRDQILDAVRTAAG